MAKIIKLTKGFKAVVDDADYKELSKHNWCYSSKGYAVRTKLQIFMHRIIMQTPIGLETDHINGNKLDNRRTNLRICTKQQNQGNRKINSNNSSGFKGVSFHKLTNKFQAYITVENKRVHLGIFITAADAALAYNKKAQKVFGKYAKLNIFERQ